MKIDPNAPAMPFTRTWEEQGETVRLTHSGLTIRAHFAAMAMAGQLTAWPEGHPVELQQLASNSVQCADALIEALNK